jgi:hypothetical protein
MDKAMPEISVHQYMPINQAQPNHSQKYDHCEEEKVHPGLQKYESDSCVCDFKVGSIKILRGWELKIKKDNVCLSTKKNQKFRT